MAGLFGWMEFASGSLKRARRLIEEGKRAEAFPLLAKAAEAKLPEAEFQVARCYLEGAGVPPSAVEGARWLERAASQGYVDAQSMLAALYIHGIPGSAAPTAASRASELSASRPAAALSSFCLFAMVPYSIPLAFIRPHGPRMRLRNAPRIRNTCASKGTIRDWGLRCP